MPRSAVVAATASLWADKRRKGSAVLIDGRYLLTAAHTLKGLKDSAELIVKFPDSKEPGLPVTVAPLQSDVDVAVLDLGPDLVGLPAPVELWAGQRLPERVEVFGYPTGEKAVEGVWREFAVAGPTASGSIQLRWEEQAGTFIGHSGGPVLDRDTHRLAGILIEGSEQGRFSRFVPLALIAKVWDGLTLPWLYAGEDARPHITRRAYGRLNDADDADLFRGREAALDAIGAWLDRQVPPGLPLVITGSPGSGKSAVLARAAIVSEHAARIPGLVFHARGATLLGLLDAVAAACGLETPDSTSSLLTRLKDRHKAEPSTSGRLAVMVDALDEAAPGQATAIAEALSDLARLPWLRVVVATRPLSAGDRFGYGSLLTRLRITAADAASLVDLDSPAYLDRAALTAFAAAVLAQQGSDAPGPAATIYRKDRRLCQCLAAVLADRAHPNFLVAAITASTLADAPTITDPDAPGFDPASLPATVGEALDKYLMSLADRDRWQARALLTALAYARGAGISDGLWLAFATALGYKAERVDLDALRGSRAADYLVQSTAGDRDAAVRLFHQALVDQLLAGRPRSDESSVLDALLADVTAAGGWPEAGCYALQHGAEHAAAAGRLDELVADPRFVIHADQGRLAAALADTPPTARTATEIMILQDASQAAALSPGRRAGIYALAAAHAGLPELMDRFNTCSTAELQPVWAHARGTSSQILIGHTGGVLAVAIGRLGQRDVIVSAGNDETVRVWSETGQPVGAPLTGHVSEVTAVAIGRLGQRLTATATKGMREPRCGEPVAPLLRAGPHVLDRVCGCEESHEGRPDTQLRHPRRVHLGSAPDNSAAAVDGDGRMGSPCVHQRAGRNAPRELARRSRDVTHRPGLRRTSSRCTGRPVVCG